MSLKNRAFNENLVEFNNYCYRLVEQNKITQDEWEDLAKLATMCAKGSLHDVKRLAESNFFHMESSMNKMLSPLKHAL